MELQLEDGVDLNGSQARSSAARGRFAFQGAQLVLRPSSLTLLVS